MSQNEDKLIKAIRKIEKDFGPGITISFGDSETGVDFHYTNKISKKNLPENIEEVEMVSTETNDKELLHKLVTETKK